MGAYPASLLQLSITLMMFRKALIALKKKNAAMKIRNN
jgi:hypothetical protein